MLKIAALILFAASLNAVAQTPSSSIDLPPGANLLLSAKGKGVQIYSCTDGRWVLKAPDAKLLDAAGKQIGMHFCGGLRCPGAYSTIPPITVSIRTSMGCFNSRS